MKKWLLIVGVCLVAGLEVCGLELNPKHDPVSVMGYRQKAEAGDAEAMFLLSQALATGLGCERDESKAMQYAMEAAKRGMGLAWRTVGLGYENGWKGEKDVKKAAQCYAKFLEYARPLAENGDAWSQCQLGMCYYCGNGVRKDCAEAVKWWRKAAEQGHAAAQCSLGCCYAKGEGVEKDHAEAVKWFRKAGEQGYAVAQFALGCCYAKGEGVEKDHAEAAKWYRKAAEQGVAVAQFALGVCYDRGVEKDYAEAVKWYRKAAEQGVAGAQCSLGCCYAKGEGVEKDHAEAVKWYRKAAEQGYAAAQFKLGVCYEDGEGVEKDEAEAVKWYRKAAEQGYAAAQTILEILENRLKRDGRLKEGKEYKGKFYLASDTCLGHVKKPNKKGEEMYPYHTSSCEKCRDRECVVRQVIGGSSLLGGGRILVAVGIERQIVIETKRVGEYADGDELLDGWYVYKGHYTFVSTDGSTATVNEYVDIGEGGVKKVLQKNDK